MRALPHSDAVGQQDSGALRVRLAAGAEVRRRQLLTDGAVHHGEVLRDGALQIKENQQGYSYRDHVLQTSTTTTTTIMITIAMIIMMIMIKTTI